MNPLEVVPRDAFDSLANAYWIHCQIRRSQTLARLGREFVIAEFHEYIDGDPSWVSACDVLEPGLRAGLTTSMTVAESIRRRESERAPEQGDKVLQWVSGDGTVFRAPDLESAPTLFKCGLRADGVNKAAPSFPNGMGDVCHSCGAHWMTGAQLGDIDDAIKPWRDRALAAEAKLAAPHCSCACVDCAMCGESPQKPESET